MGVFRESVGLKRRIATRNQLDSVTWFHSSAGKRLLDEFPSRDGSALTIASTVHAPSSCTPAITPSMRAAWSLSRAAIWSARRCVRARANQIKERRGFPARDDSVARLLIAGVTYARTHIELCSIERRPYDAWPPTRIRAPHQALQ